MRLLRRSDTGDFCLTQVGNEAIPPYAILSHTWGADTEEVTFEDLTNGTGKDKPGYNKIRFCGEQAAQDGLEWFWIDTCCIDKTNKAELSQVIKSMFRWYQNAARCYVYLSDVSTSKWNVNNELSEFTWEPAFRESRWFTRGWTLQELLAPRSVEFFSREGKKLGDKRTVERQIHEITGIAILAIRGTSLREFGVEERLSWAKSRQTTRKEDKAYSLLGVFGIHMSLIYGEGEDNAFKRLRKKIDKLLDDLRQQKASGQMEIEDWDYIQHARLTDPRDDKKRIEETKGGLLLEDAYRRIPENSDFQQRRDDPQSRSEKDFLLAKEPNEVFPSGKVEFLGFCRRSDIDRILSVDSGRVIATLEEAIRESCRVIHGGFNRYAPVRQWFRQWGIVLEFSDVLGTMGRTGVDVGTNVRLPPVVRLGGLVEHLVAYDGGGHSGDGELMYASTLLAVARYILGRASSE